MRDKIKNIPFLGKLLGYIYYYIVKTYKFIICKQRKYVLQHRWNKIKHRILRDFSDSSDNEIRELTENIRKQGCIRTFNYPFYEQYSNLSVEVFIDHAVGGYPYVMHKISETEKKRIYFPITWGGMDVATVYRQLLAEQDKDSPHCYENEEYKVENDAIVLDMGVAEGNFSIGCIDKAKHIYLFEGNSIWWKPLELTFKDWKEKVTLVPKYVSDIDDGQYISLDTFLKEQKFADEQLFIKMDIEGYEERVLDGCREELKNLEKQGVELTMAVCCYHKQESEKKIRKILSQIGFNNVANSKGFMIINWLCAERIYPYFRRGILFASRKQKGK